MAPLVPPPPVISLEQALDIQKRILSGEEVKGGKLHRRPSFSFGALFGGGKASLAAHSFTGAGFVDWAVEQKLAKDEIHAVKVGQALLEHRLAHHVTDDFDFENDASKVYAFICEESVETRMLHSALSHYIANPELYHQGELELKVKHMFFADSWTKIYAILDDASVSPRMIHFFKRFSAASAPIMSFAIEDCMCHLEECMDCKTDFYCFNLKANNKKTQKDVVLTLCANHSKRQEGWLSALMEAGVEFAKEDLSDVLKLTSLFQLSAKALNSDEIVPLERYRGNVCLVVNVASKWGLTPRDYTEMVALYNQLHSRGFTILAFPCNQFGSQEQGDEAQIAAFVQTYNVEFPMFGKIDVNGNQAHPVFQFLKAKLGGVLGSSIKWNFTKFLCDKNGVPVKRYGPPTAPSTLVKDIEELLDA